MPGWVCTERPTMGILLLSLLESVSAEHTIAGFEPICCCFVYDEISSLVLCKLSMRLFTLAQGSMCLQRCKEFSYWELV